ncbi:MAG TPA: ABC transporter substrate-binding protein [Caldimonas sp.]|jgi:putative ABC transport system substrate-binding protein|nr:ABC transporter substrate-binding protein [Caldimonas sp.]HEX2541513.1 ABC transporter substrate-binding protein [Caldimonas sp.]
MLTRRELSLVALIALTAASAARPQRKPALIGLLSPYTTTKVRPFRDTFVRALGQNGHTVGRDFLLLERYAEGDNERLLQLAHELVAARVDLILTSSTNAARAAQQATSTIPIVFEAVGDPVRAGFAESVSRPGRNMTGLSNFSGDLTAKRLELLKEAVPRCRTVAVLANPSNPFYASTLQRVQPFADKLELKVLLVSAGTSDSFEEAFQAMKRAGADALLETADAYLWMHGEQIANLALRHALPSISAFHDLVEAGGLMSYGVDMHASVQQAAAFVDKILRGGKPQELPIEQPRRLMFAVNARTAGALGLSIPQSILLRADMVIR